MATIFSSVYGYGGVEDFGRGDDFSAGDDGVHSDVCHDVPSVVQDFGVIIGQNGRVGTFGVAGRWGGG